MEISSIELICKSGTRVLEKKGSSFASEDVRVDLDCGKLNISGQNSEIYELRLHTANTFFKNAHVLGDAWERGYGDLEWELMPDKAMPWYFCAVENGINYCFGVKVLPNAMCSWECNKDEIILRVDVRNGSNPICLNGRVLTACEIVEAVYNTDTYSALQDFCRMMCEKPHSKNKAIFGGNDWYCNYGDNSYDKIIEHTKRIVECSPNSGVKPYMVIDDGWQICHHGNADAFYNGGPWKCCNRNFKDMKKMAEDITRLGAIPGIWFRPLNTMEKFPPECILHQNKFNYILDPSSEITLAQVAEDIKTLKDWGYKLIKHDFSTRDICAQYGFGMTEQICNGEVVFADRTKTTAEIIKNLYMTIREAAGDDILLMGCNTFSHLSAGIFDLQRTGDDTSGFEWERTRQMGVNTLAFRMAQHNNFYIVDADCVGITNKIDWEKNRQWLDVVAKSGTPLFVSIAQDAYTDEVKSALKAAFEKSASNLTVSKPLDWFDTKTPQNWESTFGVDTYDWS